MPRDKSLGDVDYQDHQASPTSQACHQHVSFLTSVTNSIVTKNHVFSAIDERLVNFQRLPRVFDWYEELIRSWFCHFWDIYWSGHVIKLLIFSFLNIKT